MEGGLGARCHDSQQSTARVGFRVLARVHYGNAVIDKADTTHSSGVIISIISHSHKTDDNFGRKGE